MDRRVIANKLVTLRGDRTQETVAKAVGISTSALAMYECAQRVPRDEIKLALANYFGVSIQSLFFDDEVYQK